MTNTATSPIITYDIDFSRYYEHLVRVSLRFCAKQDKIQLWLPTWIAGSYLLREFSKHLEQVSYQVHTQQYPAQKLSKNRYLLDKAQAGETITVSYWVYCHDLSVRSAFVDNRRIFANFTSLLLMVAGDEQTPCQISLFVPQTFLAQNPQAVLASGLKYQTFQETSGRRFVFETLPAFDSFDYPLEFAEQSQTEFVVTYADRPIAHRFFVAGYHQANLERLTTDVQKICQSYVDWLGDVPFADYTFMLMVTGDDYGGLEHINSTALLSSRNDLPTKFEPDEPSEGYQRLLGLCSHEYFHAWWVKSVRPDVMMDNDLQTEAYTTLLWVFEGFTSYIDDLMLLASGVIDKDSYFKLLLAQINRYYQTDGRANQSVAESSFDAWIKLYRPDENSSNQGVSYYNKGVLVALCLDLSLLKYSSGKYRLFDVIKTFYQYAKQSPNKRFGMTTDNLSDVIAPMIGADVWTWFYQSYVVGCVELPIQELLNQAGLVIETKPQTKPWGMRVESTAMGLVVKHISRDSMASLAGLSVGDVLIAIDGIKASQTVLDNAINKQQADQQSVLVHAFRRDELCTLTIQQGQETIYQKAQTFAYQEHGWLDFTKIIPAKP